MKHFQYSVMGHGILLRSLGWATKISGEISFPPPAHPTSYFMTSPLGSQMTYFLILIVFTEWLDCSPFCITFWSLTCC